MNALVILVLIKAVSADYWTDRASLIELDSCKAIGTSIVLSNKEEQVNQILMSNKLKEYDEGFEDPKKFAASVHFFKSKNQIEQSNVFNFIRKIPKGASLHSHDTALVSAEYLYNLTFRDNLYGCVMNGRLTMHFFNTPDNDCNWQLLAELRQKNSSFDDFVKAQLTLIVDDPVTTYPSITEVWNRFMEIFGTVFGLVGYRPIFQDYFYQALKELYEDNVMYIEFRGVLPPVYELDGTVYTPEEVVKLYTATLENFKADYPKFHGGRFIFAPSRFVDNKTVDNYIVIATKLKRMYPDFIAGFDLVGQEDRGRPLMQFIPQLLELSKTGMKFFFHAGETDWFGTSTDDNLFDAILLNTTRIGHGYALLKHPQLLQEVKTRKIAIEVSPISNQVLKLVDDLRNHPGAFLVSSGYPVVITCDDPSFWGAEGLSYDWYMAFMAFGSRESDLRLLKQLAINSIVYSAMDETEKCEAFTKWEQEWEKFLDFVLENKFYKYYDYYSVHNVK